MAYEIDPVWISWVALVDAKLAALAGQFSDEDLIELDNKIMFHHVKFDEAPAAVPSLPPFPTVGCLSLSPSPSLPHSLSWTLTAPTPPPPPIWLCPVVRLSVEVYLRST